MAEEEERSFAPNTVSSNRGQVQGGVGESAEPDRDAAGQESVGDLGEGTPPNVDVHNLGQEDNPQQEWGEQAGQDAVFSTNPTRRPVRTEAERGQGAKTRRMNKDIVSRRTP
jgi:hypothetical protein